MRRRNGPTHAPSAGIRTSRVTVGLAVAAILACTGSDARPSGEPSAGEVARAAPGAAQVSPDGAPRVEQRYQSSIDRAWAAALAGQSPAGPCAGVKGRAVGTNDVAGAARALFACNVDIPARYFLTYLDGVESGERTCPAFSTAVITQLPAMTMDVEGFEEIARAARQGDEEAADADARGAAGAVLGEAAGAATAGSAGGGPAALVRQRLAARTAEVCPGFERMLQN